MNATRRGLFGWLAAALVTPAAAKVLPEYEIIAPASIAGPLVHMGVNGGLYEDLAAITLKAFTPKLVAQITDANPLVQQMHRIQERRIREIGVSLFGDYDGHG